MKNITRFSLGLISSLFLNLGLVRVAELFAPEFLGDRQLALAAASSPDCEICSFPDL